VRRLRPGDAFRTGSDTNASSSNELPAPSVWNDDAAANPNIILATAAPAATTSPVSESASTLGIHVSFDQDTSTLPAGFVNCQSAFKLDPVSASNFDPFERRVLTVARAVVGRRAKEIACYLEGTLPGDPSGSLRFNELLKRTPQLAFCRGQSLQHLFQLLF
jgi:hypothetical protein